GPARVGGAATGLGAPELAPRPSAAAAAAPPPANGAATSLPTATAERSLVAPSQLPSPTAGPDGVGPGPPLAPTPTRAALITMVPTILPSLPSLPTPSLPPLPTPSLPPMPTLPPLR